MLGLPYAGRSLVAITLSMGLALYPIQGVTGKAVVYAADEALYEAKHQGRDRVVLVLSTAEEPPV